MRNATFIFCFVLLGACTSDVEKQNADKELISLTKKRVKDDLRSGKIMYYFLADDTMRWDEGIEAFYLNKLGIKAEINNEYFCGNAPEEDIHFYYIVSETYQSTMDSMLIWKYGIKILEQRQQFCDSHRLYKRSLIGK